MARYVLVGRDFDFAEFSARSSRDDGPAHALADLCERLDATVLSPGVVPSPNRVLRALFTMLGRGFSTPQVWAVALEATRRTRRGDLVYATGEDLGIAALVLGLRRRRKHRPTMVVAVVWPDRARTTRLVLRFRSRVARILTASPESADRVRAIAGASCPPVSVFPAMMDLKFFSPSPAPMPRARPLVVSAGLVSRDYVTLAAAVTDLPVDVDVCAMSSMPADMASPAYPRDVPPNMRFGQQSLRELRDLYRAAALVVVPLEATNHSAGLTVVWEAMAVGAPVIATDTPGPIGDLILEGLIEGVTPEDPAALRAAMTRLLAEPERARAMATRARAYVVERVGSDGYVETMVRYLLEAEAGTRVSTP